VFSIFQTYFNEIKTQSSIFIHVFHSDNALKYLFNQFQHLMTANSILHQTSYPSTKKNGVPNTK